MVRTFFISLSLATFLTILSLAVLSVGFAQVRSSTNYQLQSDSLNVGGGLSSSTNYTQESTIGEIATGRSSSTEYSLQAGYQQMQEVFLSLVPGENVIMDTSILGLTGGTSNGSTTFRVITDSPAGYLLTIQAENEPAMQRSGGSETIADYDAGVDADFSFLTNADDAHFGFSPQGVDVVQAFLDNTATCGVGSNNTNLACWDGMATTATPIAVGSGSNHPAGATTTVNFRVGVGSGAGVIAGLYIATTTVTALPL
jgi:hypothetical protein